MTSGAGVVVWSTWALHAEAVVAVLRDAGLPARVVEEPTGVDGLLVVGASVADGVPLLESRRGDGRVTIVWGGTLPPPRVAALRALGVAAYVSMLQPPSEVVRVVEQVLAGDDIAWPTAPEPMATLTPRERMVAESYLVRWADLSRAEVAARLGLSERTLKVHIANVRDKTGHEGTATRDGLRHELVARGWLV